MSSAAGSLVVAGTGIRAPAHTTSEVIAHIRNADVVFVLLADPLAEYWVATLNPSVESLAGAYAVGKPRWQTYAEMVARIVERVFGGARVCAAAYGHPGVFAYPLHQAVREVRARGLPARMLPGISAEDCLFADLGIDPSTFGASSFEALDFVLHRRPLDTSASLILWQIGMIGEFSVKAQRGLWNADGLTALRDKLLEYYAPEHIVSVYEAARYSRVQPHVERIELRRLTDADVSVFSTLFVPPASEPVFDSAMAHRLGIAAADFDPAAAT